MLPFRLTLARLLARPLPPVVAEHASKRIYPYERGRLDDVSFRLRARTGSPFVGTTRDRNAYMVSIHGYCDWRVLAAATYVCRPGDTIVEVGANVGTETVGFADIVGPWGHVHAFEPVPANVEQLRRAVTAAGLTQVEVIPAAAADAAGTQSFVAPRDGRDSGTGYLGDRPPAGQTAITVPCLTLDDYMRHKGPVRLLAMDVEGAEVLTLRGGRATIRRDLPVIVAEAEQGQLARFGFILRDLWGELAGHGYQAFEIDRFGLSAAKVENYSKMCNWLALPARMIGQARSISRYLTWCGLMPGVRGLNPLNRGYAGAGRRV
jgi:FkbM family methyltransferase